MFSSIFTRRLCLLLLLLTATFFADATATRQLRITLLHSTEPIDITGQPRLENVQTFQTQQQQEKRDQHVIVVKDGCTAHIKDDQIGPAVTSIFADDVGVVSSDFTVTPHVSGTNVDIVLKTVQQARDQFNANVVNSRELDTTVRVPLDSWFLLSSVSAQTTPAHNVKTFSTSTGFRDKGYVYIRVELLP